MGSAETKHAQDQIMSEEEVAKLKRVTEESEAAEREGRPTTAEVMGSVQQKHSQDKIMSEAEVAKLKRVTEESEAAEREARPKTSSAGKRAVTLPDAASPPTRSANANADSPPRVRLATRTPALTPALTTTLAPTLDLSLTRYRRSIAHH